MGESHIKQELPDTCLLIERYNFFSTKLHDYSSFDEFVNDLEHKSNLCNFLERANIIRDIIILKVAEFNKEGLLPQLKDSLTFTEIVSLCRNVVPIPYTGTSYYDPDNEKPEIVFKEEKDVHEPLSYVDDIEIKPEIAIVGEKPPDEESIEHVLKNGKLKCSFCENLYKTRKSLLRHARKTHPEEYKLTNTYTCVFCHVTLKKSTFDEHQKTCYGEAPIKTEPNTNDAPNPVKTEPTYPCADCDKRFVTVDDADKHKRKHDPIQCSQCQAQVTRGTLNAHRKQAHAAQPFDGECKICHKHYGRRSLTQHMERHRYKALRDDPNADPVLLARMRSKYLSESFAPCDICGKVFRMGKALKNHVKRHDSARNYACTECPKRFVAREGLRSHVQSHKEKPTCKCQYCEKVFKYDSTRREHEKAVHFGIRKYSCSYCDKSFTCWASRRYHERLHTGECPFKCSHCDRAFPQPNGLKSHLKTHMRAGK